MYHSHHDSAKQVGLGLLGAFIVEPKRPDVVDDARGFSLADAEERRPGMGIFAMRERVALVDGRVDIDTAPGRGTHVRALVPATR
jgi:signal transduction histidine kinase